MLFFWKKQRENGFRSLVGHELPIGLVERPDFDAVTGHHAAAVVRRTGPGHVGAGLRNGDDWSAGRRVRGSLKQ